MRTFSYFAEVGRVFLIAVALGVAIMVLKQLAYGNYFAGPEFVRDLKIWVALSIALSLLSPALELVKKRYWDIRDR